ncbi:MAG: DNA methyltransferase, partial [Chloroflexota bacterium]
MLHEPTPNSDPTGEEYAFEKGADKLAGGGGFADVWKRGRFAWEYKSKGVDLKAAYRQLNEYREALENPPLLVVSDMDRFEVHTNFTGTVAQSYDFTLADLAADPEEPLRILRAVFRDPEALRPKQTTAELTEEAAQQFAQIALSLRERGHEPAAVAHFLDRVLFCLFSEDVGLLPKGLLGRLAKAPDMDPSAFSGQLGRLFELMSHEGGGYFGTERVEWFNGNLFDGSETIPLEADEVEVVGNASRLDWSQIEPAIFGTLFERGLDPDRRGQLGAHYTDRESIEKLVEPVLMAPLRDELEQTKSEIADILGPGVTWRGLPPKKRRAVRERFEAFLERIRTVTVLDPACGSGNFLYVCLQSLKDLEREAILWGSEAMQMPMQAPQVGPHQL